MVYSISLVLLSSAVSSSHRKTPCRGKGRMSSMAEWESKKEKKLFLAFHRWAKWTRSWRREKERVSSQIFFFSTAIFAGFQNTPVLIWEMKATLQRWHFSPRCFLLLLTDLKLMGLLKQFYAKTSKKHFNIMTKFTFGDKKSSTATFLIFAVNYCYHNWICFDSNRLLPDALCSVKKL